MRKEISLAQLTTRPDSPTRMSRQTTKKLRKNIERIGYYESVVVRPHATRGAAYEILNGHARVEALRGMGRTSADCDVWKLDDEQARLYLAARDAIRGESVPELRMSLLLTLLHRRDPAELCALIPETEPYLRKIARLRDSVIRENVSENKRDGYFPVGEVSMQSTSDHGVDERITLTMRMTRAQYAAVKTALDAFMEQHSLEDMGEALAIILEKPDRGSEASVYPPS